MIHLHYETNIYTGVQSCIYIQTHADMITHKQRDTDEIKIRCKISYKALLKTLQKQLLQSVLKCFNGPQGYRSNSVHEK